MTNYQRISPLMQVKGVKRGLGCNRRPEQGAPVPTLAILGLPTPLDSGALPPVLTACHPAGGALRAPLASWLNASTGGHPEIKGRRQTDVDLAGHITYRDRPQPDVRKSYRYRTLLRDREGPCVTRGRLSALRLENRGNP